ncbi:MAG: hypothetical protein P8Y42_04465 [Exilibacterium sp.]
MSAICKIDTANVAPASRLDYWNTILADIFTGLVIDSQNKPFGGQFDRAIPRKRYAGGGYGCSPRSYRSNAE